MNLFQNDERIVLANFVGVGRWKEKLFKMFTFIWDNPRILLYDQETCLILGIMLKYTFLVQKTSTVVC